MDLFLDLPNSLSFIRSQGLIIFIHHSSDIYPLTQIEGINLPTGFDTDLIVKQTVYNRKGYPYSNCIEDIESLNAYDSELFRMTVKQNGKYRYSNFFKNDYFFIKKKKKA